MNDWIYKTKMEQISEALIALVKAKQQEADKKNKMKYALQIFNHNLNLACVLNNAGIDELNDIDVIDAEIVPSNVERYNDWMKNIIKSKHYADNLEMIKGYHVVANFKINQNERFT